MLYNQEYYRPTRVMHWSHTYVVMESDLRPKSSNTIFKYADDTNLLVPECTDVEIVVEYQNVKDTNGMVINELKTKELVFHRPCPRRCHMGSPRLSMVLNE